MFCCRSTQNNPLGKSGQRLLYKNYLFKNKTEVNKTGANPESLVSVCVGGGRGGDRGNRAIASSYRYYFVFTENSLKIIQSFTENTLNPLMLQIVI